MGIVGGLGLFQSTPPHGGRLAMLGPIQKISRVSIHAPAWGATIGDVTGISGDVFQSTLPHGERLYELLMI